MPTWKILGKVRELDEDWRVATLFTLLYDNFPLDTKTIQRRWRRRRPKVQKKQKLKMAKSRN